MSTSHAGAASAPVKFLWKQHDFDKMSHLLCFNLHITVESERQSVKAKERVFKEPSFLPQLMG